MLFPKCNDCITCAWYKNGCLAGHGDDDYSRASKKILTDRLNFAKKNMNDQSISKYRRRTNKENFDRLSYVLNH